MTDLFIVGEAYGFEESQANLPFTGPSGKLLDKLLDSVGLSRARAHVTNVFMLRPPGNKVDFFFNKPGATATIIKALGYKSKDVTEWMRSGEGYPEDVKPYLRHPKYGAVGYLKPEFQGELDRLREEVLAKKPPVIIALGNTALWALTGKTGIKSYRGAFLPCRWDPSVKVMPTFHPAAVLREYKYVPNVQADLRKAVGQVAEKPAPRTIWLADRLSDLDLFQKLYIRDILAFDVEEEGTRQITSFSLAPTPTICLVVPVFNPSTGENAWSEEDEVLMWWWLKKMLTNPGLTVIMHNSTYDLSQLLHYDIKPRGPVKDTMLMHHAYQPEASKSLGELGALYCNETAWKNMRSWSKDKEGKSDS